MELPPEERLPPVLVVNLQLPTYPVSLMGHFCYRTSRVVRLILRQSCCLQSQGCCVAGACMLPYLY